MNSAGDVADLASAASATNAVSAGGDVLLDVSGRVAAVTLSNPGKFNAMSRAMWLKLREVFSALQLRPDLRCVLVRGEGGHFCAGGDISEYASFRFEEASLHHFHENEVWGGLQAMLDCDLPVVAQIEGNCMGAGIEIASCCDIRIAGESAKFGAPIARLGFPMAPREVALVLRAAGELTVREMLLEAAVLPAVLVLQRGFLSRLVADDGVATESVKTTRRIADLAPQAARINKQYLRVLGQSAYTHSATDFVAGAYAYADSPEHREGIAAFIEKRKAAFL